MADIRKTFNFRDGVQVDDEVLVVRGNRVGFGYYESRPIIRRKRKCKYNRSNIYSKL